MPSLQRTQIYLENAQIAALDARAKAQGVTRSDLIRAMIDKGLAANDAKPSLYETIMKLPPLSEAAISGVAEERAAFDQDVETRQARWRRRNAGGNT